MSSQTDAWAWLPKARQARADIDSTADYLAATYGSVRLSTLREYRGQVDTLIQALQTIKANLETKFAEIESQQESDSADLRTLRAKEQQDRSRIAQLENDNAKQMVQIKELQDEQSNLQKSNSNLLAAKSELHSGHCTILGENEVLREQLQAATATKDKLIADKAALEQTISGLAGNLKEKETVLETRKRIGATVRQSSGTSLHEEQNDSMRTMDTNRHSDGGDDQDGDADDHPRAEQILRRRRQPVGTKSGRLSTPDSGARTTRKRKRATEASIEVKKRKGLPAPTPGTSASPDDLFDIDDVLHASFSPAPVPPAIWDRLRSQIATRTNRRKDWVEGVIEGGTALCPERYTTRYRTDRHTRGSACQYCSRKGRVCVEVENGKLRLCPVREEDRDGISGPGEEQYWARDNRA